MPGKHAPPAETWNLRNKLAGPQAKTGVGRGAGEGGTVRLEKRVPKPGGGESREAGSCPGRPRMEGAGEGR